MTIWMKALLGGALAASLATTAIAQRATIGSGANPPYIKLSPADISSDSAHGKMLRVYYSKTPDPVTIETAPEVHFACDTGPTTECYAYLKPGSKVTIRVWRKPPRVVPGMNAKGIAASGHQWRDDCVGQGDACTVTLDAGRSAGVNWIAQP